MAKNLKYDFSANGVIESDKVEQVMKSVDRGDFCKSKSNPFSDAPQGIGHSVTISAPHMVSFLTGFFKK